MECCAVTSGFRGIACAVAFEFRGVAAAHGSAFQKPLKQARPPPFKNSAWRHGLGPACALLRFAVPGALGCGSLDVGFTRTTAQAVAFGLRGVAEAK